MSFSRYGAQQLDFDFNHFVAWFESEEFGLTLEEVAEIYSLSVLGDMKNAIILLACQPDGRKSSGSGSGGGIGETNLLSNNFGSSSSVVSQVSIGESRLDILFSCVSAILYSAVVVRFPEFKFSY